MRHYQNYLPRERAEYTYRKVRYENKIFTFDIETSSFFYTDGNWKTAKSLSQKQLEDSTNLLAIPYIWQFCDNGKTYYGRTLRSFYDFCKKLNEYYPAKKIVWVHNLAFEFSFLTQDFKFNVVFARQKGKIIYCYSKELNIEFRCSYTLTMMSLENLAKSFSYITVPKAVGGLDYDLARLPCTPLGYREKNYCEIDVKIIYQFIKGFSKNYKYLADIPYTQTGIVRRIIKKKILNSPAHLSMMNKIKPDLKDYRLLTRIMRGGVTQCVWCFLDNEINNVYHVDISSSYPYVMCTKYFPMSKLEYGDSEFFDPKYLYIYHVKLYNVQAKTPWVFIPCSKCENIEYFTNYYDDTVEGKVLNAKEVDLWVTDIDLKTIKKVYDIGYIGYISYARSKKARLPIPLIKYILSLYKEKTEIKGIDSKKDYYNYLKQLLNAIFGMCLTNNFRDEQIHEDFNFWKVESMTDQKLSKKLAKDKPFLFFGWGIYVTSYARQSLFELLMKMPLDSIYTDTDSIFFINKENFKYIDEINKKRYEEIEDVSKILDIPFEFFAPKDNKSAEKPIGAWDFEKKLKRFKSCGSKKYVCETIDGEFSVTIAGCRKKYYDFEIGKEINVVPNFESFYLDSENINGGAKFKNGRSVAWHTNHQPGVILNDYLGNQYKNDQVCGTVIMNTYYTLGITRELNDFTKGMHNYYTNPYRIKL